jgi:hypothetical protein
MLVGSLECRWWIIAVKENDLTASQYAFEWDSFSDKGTNRLVVNICNTDFLI